MSFYGVKRGRNIGVFDNWHDANASVHGYSNNCVKKFYTFELAEEFVYGKTAKLSNDSSGNLEYEASGGLMSSPEEVPYHSTKSHAGYCPFHPYDDSSDDDSLISMYGRDWLAEVYVDGCCYSNGGSNPRAGIGVYWGKDSPFNVSERIRGKQTNIRAEIQAAKRAIIQASRRGFDALHLYTDSKFFKDAFENWLYKWEDDGWLLADGITPVANRKDWESIIITIEQSSLDLEIVHVAAHKGIAENEEADRLAKLGANKPTPPANTDMPASEELALVNDSRIYREMVPKPRKRTVTEVRSGRMVVVS